MNGSLTLHERVSQASKLNISKLYAKLFLQIKFLGALFSFHTPISPVKGSFVGGAGL